MSAELQNYVELLAKSQLLKSVDCCRDEFAELLIINGILTRWQSDKLADGKYKGFYLDDYLLMDFHHLDEDRSYFVALNLKEN